MSETTLTSKQLEKLDTMIGRHYMYNGRNLQVKSYAINETYVRIINTGHTIAFPVDQLAEKIEEFLPADASDETALARRQNRLAEKINEEVSRIDELETVLVSNIKKLQGPEGDKFIPQAREITQITNAIVRMNRLKFDMARESIKQKAEG